MSAHILEELEETEASEQECPKELMAVPEILNPVSGHPGQACHPILVRRWRNGQVIWEGLPEEIRLMHRRYPRPVERTRPFGESGH